MTYEGMSVHKYTFVARDVTLGIYQKSKVENAMLSMKFTLEEAVQFSQIGCIEEWVHLFLRTSGNNIPFSDGLKLQPQLLGNSVG